MQGFASEFSSAIALIFEGDSELWAIVLLSLKVSVFAVLISALIGMPVGAALAVFERVPITGDAETYGQSVVDALTPLFETYYDPDGEYTSGRSSIGSAYFEICCLLECCSTSTAKMPPRT